MQYSHVFHPLNQFVIYTQGSHNCAGITKFCFSLRFSPCGILWPVELNGFSENRHNHSQIGDNTNTKCIKQRLDIKVESQLYFSHSSLHFEALHGILILFFYIHQCPHLSIL